MILIFTYDLKGKRDYTPFYEAIKQQGVWWHYLASTWLISTSKDAEAVALAVRPYMDNQDFLLVAPMGTPYNGWLPAQAWEWINNQINAVPRSPLWAPASLPTSLSEPKSNAFWGGINALGGKEKKL
jgi:hypothetical protein